MPRHMRQGAQAAATPRRRSPVGTRRARRATRRPRPVARPAGRGQEVRGQDGGDTKAPAAKKAPAARRPGQQDRYQEGLGRQEGPAKPAATSTPTTTPPPPAPPPPPRHPTPPTPERQLSAGSRRGSTSSSYGGAWSPPAEPDGDRRGVVLVAGAQADKAARQVAPTSHRAPGTPQPFVSRAGRSSTPPSRALQSPPGRRALDAGASTGGSRLPPPARRCPRLRRRRRHGSWTSGCAPTAGDRAREGQRAHPDPSGAGARPGVRALLAHCGDLSFISLITVVRRSAGRSASPGPIWCSWSSPSSRRAGSSWPGQGRGAGPAVWRSTLEGSPRTL